MMDEQDQRIDDKNARDVISLASKDAERSAPRIDVLPASSVSQMMEMATQGFVVHRGAAPLYINQAMKDMLGVSDDRPLLQKSILEWIHRHDRERVADSVKRRMRGEAVDEFDRFRLSRPDAAEFWVNCRATLVDWPDGPAILASLTDITQLKQTERAQERSDELFKRVYHATPDMMSLTFMRTGIFLDVNDNLSNAVGLSRRAILGQSIFDLEIWEDPTIPLKIAATLKSDGCIRHMEANVRRRDGSTFPVKFSAELMIVDGEKVVLLIGRDITDEKRYETELRKSRDAAELANRTKSEFLANMSHELRTPLNAILGFSEIIKDEVLGPLGDRRYSEYAADVHRSGTHLLEIINDILDLSKVEAGRLEIYPSRVDIPNVVSQCLRLVQERADQADVSIHSLITPDNFSMTLDRRLFKQILLNLLSNAIKFTGKGGSIHLEIKAKSDGGCHVSITDTGIGMSKEDITQALTPFGQVDGAMTRRHQGTGLGLPLVAAFVAAHQGRLKIESRPGKGTMVLIDLPDADGPENADIIWS
jgi:PAS domain S-box-containing protein